MSMKSTIEAKLKLGLRPTELEVIDESDRHEGHGGWRPGGETHFRIYVVSELFAGKNRVQCHRMINDLLAEELKESIHALAIHTSATGVAG